MGQRRARPGADAPDPPDPDAGEATPSLGDLDALSFEDALDRLEGLVDQLERGDLPLEEALAAFEQGVALTRRCAGELDEAERRIELLVKEGGRWMARDFDEAGEAD